MKKIKTTLLFLFATFYLQAQDSTYRFTLQQSIDFAYKNQTNVKNALLDDEIARHRANEIKGMGTPQIKGEFEIDDYIELPTSFIPAEFFQGEPGTYAAEIPAEAV